MNAEATPKTGRPAVEEAALDYAARGWSVIPMQARGKHPLVSWRSYQQRAAGRQEIEAWFARWPEANVGIVTGRVSGLVVVDVDANHGGAQSLAELEARHGRLPPTVEARSGGGGRHLYFRHPGGRVLNRVSLHPGIDVRGDGGCIVAPPSQHPNGRHYVWLPGHAPSDRSLARMPSHLLGPSADAPAAGGKRERWRRLIREGVHEGQRNSTIASLTGHLLWHGIDLEAVEELMLAWNRTHCRPPLADEEVVHVVHSIARTHEREAAEAGPLPWPHG